MARVLLIAGTRPPGGRTTSSCWWHPASSFVDALHRAGHVAATNDPFSWTQDLEGIVGDNREWQEAANALRWWLSSRSVDAAIAHSHGGQVLAFALAGGAKIGVVVTVAMPVREDMMEVYGIAKRNVVKWVHIRSDGWDWWQRWGTRRWSTWLMPWRWGRFTRDLSVATHLIAVPGLGHEDLMDPLLWDRQKWWSLLG